MSGAALTIPPSAEHVRVARVVAVAAARRIGLTSEQLDDVRLAVGEAVTRAVVRHENAGLIDDISLAMTDSGDEFTVVVTDKVVEQVPESDDGVALALISALVPNVGREGSVLSLTWVTSN